jgi:hypothetical protein
MTPAAGETARTAPSPGVHAEDAVDRLFAWLQRQISNNARCARTQDDVALVAQRVRLLQRHRPVDVEVLTSSTPDGGDLREIGFHDDDGHYVGVETPRVLCGHHEEAVEWPCPEIVMLLAAYGHPAERTPLATPARVG